MSKLNLQEFKDRVPAVQAMMKKIHRVDTGTQNALDIIAVSNGFTDYHRVKVVANMKHYELVANIGNESHPCLIRNEIGPCGNPESALFAARNILLNARALINWSLLEDDKDTGCTIQTFMNGEMKISTPNATMEEISPRSIDDIDCVQPFHGNFVIFDADGIIDSENEVDDIIRLFNDRESEYPKVNGDLIMAQQITLNDLYQYKHDKEAIFHAISDHGTSQFHGNYDVIVDSLAYMSGAAHTYYLFIELDRD